MLVGQINCLLNSRRYLLESGLEQIWQMKDAFLLVEASADMFIIAVVGDFVPVGRLLFDMLNIVS